MKRNHYPKKKNLTKLFITFAAVAAVSYGASVYFDGKTSSDIVVAKINNQKIYKSEINGKIREVFVGAEDVDLPALETFPPEVVEAFAKEIYLEKELVSRAKKSGVTKQEEVKNQVENAQNRIIANAYLASVIKEKVSDQKIRDKYAELNNGASKKELLVAQIVVKNKADAEKILSSLNAKKSKNRASFAELAKRNSLDKQSANNGGKLGYLTEENLSKEVLEVVSTMKKGEVSKPFAVKDVFVIVKLEDVREGKAASFEEVKDSLREQMIKDETGAIYKDIFDDIKIEILLKKAEEKSALEATEEKNEEVKNEQKSDENAKQDEQTNEQTASEEKSEAESAVKAE